MTDTPNERILRGYAFDPSLSQKLITYEINEIEYRIDWENLEHELKGEYLDIIDYDPTVQKRTSNQNKLNGVFYKLVNLNDRAILVNNGLTPSETNPQFHQQMVYAVGMTTIKNFEKALGRKILWGKGPDNSFIQRLRIHPHALRDANAFYSPTKKAILFGYFRSRPSEGVNQMPNSMVYTCLSHDIIAHEMTHAILDGMNKKYNIATNPDVHAFHEGFADIVAIFQRFTFPDVLKHQIAETRGDLSKQNLLGQLAQQLGAGIGRYGSLRNYLGETINGEWVPHVPDPNEYKNTLEPHARGSILVSAMFEAFLTVFKNRSRDLLRIASGGSGILPEGELHPDLVNRLSKEASKTAKHFLNICIRAVDYCPPVDITFGDYLRAIITADCDLVKKDIHGYRISIIDAFKRRGIFPDGLNNINISSLCLQEINTNNNKQLDDIINILSDFFRQYSEDVAWLNKRSDVHDVTLKYIIGGTIDKFGKSKNILGLHHRLNSKLNSALAALTGIYYGEHQSNFGINTSSIYEGRPTFFIDDLRVVSRIGADGYKLKQVIFSIQQSARFKIESRAGKIKFIPKINGEFKFEGGSSLIFDINSNQLKYSVCKPLIVKNKFDEVRRLKQYKYRDGQNQSPHNEFAATFGLIDNNLNEPFSILHNH